MWMIGTSYFGSWDISGVPWIFLSSFVQVTCLYFAGMLMDPMQLIQIVVGKQVDALLLAVELLLLLRSSRNSTLKVRQSQSLLLLMMSLLPFCGWSCSWRHRAVPLARPSFTKTTRVPSFLKPMVRNLLPSGRNISIADISSSQTRSRRATCQLSIVLLQRWLPISSPSHFKESYLLNSGRLSWTCKTKHSVTCMCRIITGVCWICTGSNVRSILYQYPCDIFILYDAYVHLLWFDWCVLRNTINHTFTYGSVLSTWKATYLLSEFLSVVSLHPVFRMSALKRSLIKLNLVYRYLFLM